MGKSFDEDVMNNPPRYHLTNLALEAVKVERDKQEELKKKGKFAYTCADKEMNDFEALAVLAEEFGEVAHEVNEGIGDGRKINKQKLKKELVQTAAVCIAWLEKLGTSPWTLE